MIQTKNGIANFDTLNDLYIMTKNYWSTNISDSEYSIMYLKKNFIKRLRTGFIGEGGAFDIYKVQNSSNKPFYLICADYFADGQVWVPLKEENEIMQWIKENPLYVTDKGRKYLDSLKSD